MERAHGFYQLFVVHNQLSHELPTGYTDVIGQTHVHLMQADAGIELGSIPASEPTVNDPSPFRVRLDVYKLTVDAGCRNGTERRV